MKTCFWALASLACLECGVATKRITANPIRKVVTMLQNMEKKVSEEAEKEENLYKKYMCYCKTSSGTLEQSISDNDAKVEEVSSKIKESKEAKEQLEASLNQAKEDRKSAQTSIATATSMREKQTSTFNTNAAETNEDIDALKKAIAALEKGVAGSFLQSVAPTVRRLILVRKEIAEADRQDVVAFLSASQSNGYAPQSGQIIGILKQMLDEMSDGLAQDTAAEKEAAKKYEDLLAAKNKELAALQRSIEEKLVRVGDLSVAIESMKTDLSDTQEALIEDKKFLAEMAATCKTKKDNWEAIKATRSEELVALAETIKLLQDDDALELFKKTLPSSSFMQMKVSGAAVRQRALATINSEQVKKLPATSTRLDFIALALRGKNAGFEKVSAMIDGMVETLKQEQQDDDDKKAYCGAELDAADDKRKEYGHAVSDADAAIEATKSTLENLAKEIEALKAGIAELDNAVSSATETRKQESADYTELIAQNSAAKKLIGIAKNRLQKFYNPKLYVPPPQQELSEEDRIVVGMGGTLAPTPAPGGIAGTGVTVFAQAFAKENFGDAPPPPPQSFGAYKKKSEESAGVIAMMDLLVKDLDKETTEAETEEKDAQADYEATMKDSAEKRAQDVKTLEHKKKAFSDAEGALQESGDEKKSASVSLAETLKYISALHADCDWLVQYFDTRREARTSEIEALRNAKAVLHGSDYSFVQIKRHLRG